MQWCMVTWPASTMNKGKWDALFSFSLQLPLSLTPPSLSLPLSGNLDGKFLLIGFIVELHIFQAHWLGRRHLQKGNWTATKFPRCILQLSKCLEGTRKGNYDNIYFNINISSCVTENYLGLKSWNELGFNIFVQSPGDRSRGVLQHSPATVPYPCRLPQQPC